MKTKLAPRRTGVTLLELLLVSAITAILAALALPSTVRALRAGKEKLRRVTEIHETKLNLFSREAGDNVRSRAQYEFMEDNWLGYGRYQEPWTNALIRPQ